MASQEKSGGDGDSKLVWTSKDIPAPEFSVLEDEGKYRCELTVFIRKGGKIKDVRVRGPRRKTRTEARKDGRELQVAAFKGGEDPALFDVRNRRKELDEITWQKKDLVSEEAEETKEQERLRQLQAARDAKLLQKQLAKQGQKAEDDLPPELRPQEANFHPVGPHWSKVGQLTDHPDILGLWLIHERQDSSGKHQPWLWFNATTGKYYNERASGKGWAETGTPHDPQVHAVTIRHGSACLPGVGGRKEDLAVVLPELHRTGFLLKQALHFLDKPASIILLVDGLRGSGAAAEFCAKRFHTQLLPRLSARASDWEDFELADVLGDAVEALDGLVLESPVRYAGCGLAVALVVGTRVVVGTLGGTRALVLRPPTPSLGQQRAPAAASEQPWSMKLLSGGVAHTVDSLEEQQRIASASDVLLPGAGELHSASASPELLAAIEKEPEREMLRIARALHSFAALGLVAEDLQGGASSVRTRFRRRSLLVHPDKVGESLKSQAVKAFAKLEAAASAVEAMLNADMAATKLLFNLHQAMDDEGGILSTARALQLLGLREGCTEKEAKAAAEKRYHTPLGRLQNASREDVARGLKVMAEVVDAAARVSSLWAPAAADRGVRVTRAIGCKDLKAVCPLLATGLSTEVIHLAPGTELDLVLLTGGASALDEAAVAARVKRHHGRPRAAALRVATDAASLGSGKGATAAVGAVCAHITMASSSSADASMPAAKRARLGGGATYGYLPERVRICHVLLKWADLKEADDFARLTAPVTRTQSEAESELLALLEQLSDQPKAKLQGKFQAACREKSECQSAANVPYADLGWIEPGSMGPSFAAFEAAAFDLAVGGISDVVITGRGASLIYRLA